MSHVGSTVSRLESSPAWRIVVHWHEHLGQIVPAGVEVRCYGVTDENEDDFWGGQEHPQHEQPVFSADDRPRPVSSELLANKVRWGGVINEHLARLSALLVESAGETADLNPRSAAFMSGLSQEAAGRRRATDETYRLVAALHNQALMTSDRARSAEYVRAQLNEFYGYELTDSASDRSKVRQWLGEARKRGYLPPSNRSKEE